MTFEVEVAGRTRTVSIEPTDRQGRYRVIVDGRALVVDASRTGEFGLSLLLASVPKSVTFSASESPETRTVPVSIDLQVTPAGRHGQRMVNLQGRLALVTVNGRRTGHAESGTEGQGEISITAPMPGRVVRVLVGTGEEIAQRQGVIVVEAMKMENELRAPRAGRVKEITVQPGASVEAGRVLAVIE